MTYTKRETYMETARRLFPEIMEADRMKYIARLYAKCDHLQYQLDSYKIDNKKVASDDIDEWFSLDADNDLNIFTDMDGKVKLVVYPVIDGKTNTECWKQLWPTAGQELLDDAIQDRPADK